MPEPRQPGEAIPHRQNHIPWSRKLLARWPRRNKHAPTQPQAHPASEPEGESPIPEHIYCKQCGYDLSATHDLILCPECGREFDYQQPRSFDRVPKREMRQRAARRMLLILLLTAITLAGLYWSVIPRPISKHHPTLWLWFNQPIGVQRSPLYGPTTYRTTWLFGQPRSIRIYDQPPGDPTHRFLATIERPSTDQDQFTLTVHDAGLKLESLLIAFNTFRSDDEVFGIQWERHQPRDRSVGAFSSDGTMMEVMSAIVRHYGIQVQPISIADAASVCIFLPAGVQLPDQQTAQAAYRIRLANERSGNFGPPPRDDHTPVGQAFAAIDRHLSSIPGPTMSEIIDGQLVRATLEQAEYLGYRIRTREDPIILYRIDWRSAMTGWY